MKHKKIFVLALLAITFISLFPHQPVLADSEDFSVDTDCASGIPSYTGALELSKQSYDVYVRLAKRGERAEVQGYVQESEDYGNCQQLGSLTASGDRWTKMGQFSSTGIDEYVLQLSSPSLASLPDANRPALMLIPHDTPVCIPDIECEVAIGDETGIVRPTGTLLNQDSLHVLRVVDPAKDKIKLVRYYADSNLMYTTSTLESFDLRYISLPGQNITRAIEYESGQKILIRGNAPNDHTDNFGNFLFRLSKLSPELFNAAVWGGVGLIVLSILLTIIHAIQRHRDWEYHHGFIHKERHELTAIQRDFLDKKEKALKWFGLGAGGLLVICGTMALIVLVDAFVAQIFTVDGRSMRETLETGDKMLLNKIPKTVANINGLEYIPIRGDVVILRAVFGATTFSDDDASDTYIIKRVIALPGERVVIADGMVTVYNKEHPEGFNPDVGSAWQKTMHPNPKTEHLDVQLGTSELFVSGDNRPESIDSRFNGPIATKEIVGVAVRLSPITRSSTNEG